MATRTLIFIATLLCLGTGLMCVSFSLWGSLDIEQTKIADYFSLGLLPISLLMLRELI